MRTLICVSDIMLALNSAIRCQNCKRPLETLKHTLEIAKDGTARVYKHGVCDEHGHQSEVQIIKAARVYEGAADILPEA